MSLWNIKIIGSQMSDKTSVNLTIPTELYPKALSAINGMLEGADDVFVDDEGLTHISYELVNYGELDFEKDLQSLSIPFSYQWAAGSEFCAGQKHLRVLAHGNIIVSQFNDDDYQKIHIDDLRNAVAKGIQSVKNLIKNKTAEFHVMSWQEQLNILAQRNNPSHGAGHEL